MTESLAPDVGRWRYGMHPQASEMRISALGRVELQLGEALRIEMMYADGSQEHLVHLQYYIATALGPWALWLSCAREDVEDCESTLRELTPVIEEAEPAKPQSGSVWSSLTGRHP
jgi:hypothetical protein